MENSKNIKAHMDKISDQDKKEIVKVLEEPLTKRAQRKPIFTPVNPQYEIEKRWFEWNDKQKHYEEHVVMHDGEGCDRTHLVQKIITSSPCDGFHTQWIEE